MKEEKRKDAEAQRVDKLSNMVIGAAIEVHRALGPGLLESVYEECLCLELDSLRLKYEKQCLVPINYKDRQIEVGFRVDIFVEKILIIELKAIEKILPVHEAQLLSYLRLTGTRLGLLLNFNTPVMSQGLKRVVNNL